MRNVALLALVLTFADVYLAAPVTIFETATVVATAGASANSPSVAAAPAVPVVATSAVVNPILTNIAATATPAIVASTATAAVVPASTSGSTSGFAGILSSLLSALTSSSSSSTSSSTSATTSSSSGSSWLSLLNSIFGLGTTSSSSVAASVSAVSPLTVTTTIAAVPTGTSTTSAVIVPTSKATSTTPSTTSTAASTSASTSTSTGGIYDAIYNSSEDIDKNFAKAILDAHNTYRADHGVAALSWAAGPYSYAKNNADNYDCSGVLTHTHGQYGENLAAGFATGPAAVAAWYVEGDTFDYTALNEYNHFTQVIWKGSTQVGCAYKDCSAEGWQLYVVCEYDPAGNYIGQEKANVLPPV